MARKRIVVTGMGIVSCFGTDIDSFYEQLLAGKSGIVPIEEFPCADYPTRFAGAIRNFDVGDYMDKKQARRVDPFIRYTMVAGKKALESAKIDSEAMAKLNKSRCGIIIGSGMGGMGMFYDGVETILTKSFKRLTPFFVPYIITNMGGALLAIDTGFMGPNYSISTACATSNFCIHAAAEQIQRGKADLMLCGGAEAAITPIGLAGFVAIGALSTKNDDPTKASRPWDQARDGFVMGEGAGVLVLESLEHAIARGAPIYAEYLGGSVNCDAYHMTNPREDGEGVAACMEEAIADAGISKEAVNYINAHATSTQAGDLCEIQAINKVFGPHAKEIKINSTKSMIGHCLGAAGGLEAIATIQAIRTGKLHPTINLDHPESATQGLDLVPNHAKTLQVQAALSNSFGFGGHNSTLVFAPYHPLKEEWPDLNEKGKMSKVMQKDESFGVIPLSRESGTWQVFLIQHRRGRYWGFPKGHAEKEETSQEAAFRELKEETNLEIVRYLQNDPILEQYHFMADGRRVFKQVLYFIAEVQGTVRLQEQEIQNGIWLPLPEAVEKVTHPEGKMILSQVEKIVAKL